MARIGSPRSEDVRPGSTKHFPGTLNTPVGPMVDSSSLTAARASSPVGGRSRALSSAPVNGRATFGVSIAAKCSRPAAHKTIERNYAQRPGHSVSRIGFGPLVGLLGQYGADEADMASRLGKLPTGSVRRRISLLRRSAGTRSGHTSLGKLEGEDVLAGGCKVLGNGGELLGDVVEESVELGVGGRCVGLVLDAVEHRRDRGPHRLRADRHQGGVVGSASLPGCAGAFAAIASHSPAWASEVTNRTPAWRFAC